MIITVLTDTRTHISDDDDDDEGDANACAEGGIINTSSCRLKRSPTRLALPFDVA
jgi:hypothetical protein